MNLSAATSEAISVLIADSNLMQAQLLSTALRRRPEFHISTCALNPGAIQQSLATRVPRVALLSMGVSNAADAISTLRQFHVSHPQVPKVLLVERSTRELVVSAFRSGARGIFSIADSNLRFLCKCIFRLSAGQVWASSQQLNYLLDLISEVPSLRVINSSGTRLLTPREEQVVALVAEGMGNRQIARELNLSEHTIKKYLFRIFEKLGISSRVELVLYAVNHGDPRPAEWVAGTPLAPIA